MSVSSPLPDATVPDPDWEMHRQLFLARKREHKAVQWALLSCVFGAVQCIVQVNNRRRLSALTTDSLPLVLSVCETVGNLRRNRAPPRAFFNTEVVAVTLQQASIMFDMLHVPTPAAFFKAGCLLEAQMVSRSWAQGAVLDIACELFAIPDPVRDGVPVQTTPFQTFAFGEEPLVGSEPFHHQELCADNWATRACISRADLLAFLLLLVAGEGHVPPQLVCSGTCGRHNRHVLPLFSVNGPLDWGLLIANAE
jgi:hypothetical protein